MKVKQLKEVLNGFDPELEVLVSRDEEGNGFNSLESVETGKAYKDGWTWDMAYDEDDEEDDPDDDDVIPVVVLWP